MSAAQLFAAVVVAMALGIVLAVVVLVQYTQHMMTKAGIVIDMGRAPVVAAMPASAPMPMASSISSEAIVTDAVAVAIHVYVRERARLIVACKNGEIQGDDLVALDRRVNELCGELGNTIFVEHPIGVEAIERAHHGQEHGASPS